MVSLERRDLALTVGLYGRSASVYNLVSQAGRFGLTEQDARAEIARIASVVQQWRECFLSAVCLPKTLTPSRLQCCRRAYFLSNGPCNTATRPRCAATRP